MSEVRLDEKEVWEIIDAGCIALGYTKDRTHDMDLCYEPLSLAVREPGSYKKKDVRTPLRDRELLFKDYQTAAYLEEGVDRLIFQDAPHKDEHLCPMRPRFHRDLLTLSGSITLGYLVYQLVTYLTGG